MKPNLFLYKNFSAEDHFTNSLCYILNMLPREIGDRFLKRIAVLAGLPAGTFGKFENAEFTGFDYQSQESTSKPDMLITTSTTRIYFENKLEAPLGNSQLERHIRDAAAVKGKLVFISNTTGKVSDDILNSQLYLRPAPASHFYWMDFEPVFDFKFRKNSVQGGLLEDFKKALRLNGIKGRILAGESDNLYTNGSKSHQLALEQLKDVLINSGFRVIKRKGEFTLRVYPQDLYPALLLNPRFMPTGETVFTDQEDKECIWINCWADIEDKEPKRRLRKLDSIHKDYPEVKVYSLRGDLFDSGKSLETVIYIPMQFLKSGKDWKIDWQKLLPYFQKFQKLLSK